MNETIEKPTREKSAVEQIVDQIGPRAFYMMGTTRRSSTGNTLTFNVRGSRAFNQINITLTPDDLYTLEFFKIHGWKITRHLTINDVQADALRRIIEDNTKLRLSL